MNENNALQLKLENLGINSCNKNKYLLEIQSLKEIKINPRYKKNICQVLY